MSSYNDNWKAFVNETKEMSDEQLQEYIGDIARAVSGLFNQSGEGDKYSGLSGLGTPGEIKASEKRKKEAIANNIKNMLNKVEKDLSDAGVEGDVLNGIMEAIRADLAAAGYEVEAEINEDTENKAFQLINTIQAIEKVADLVIKEKVKEIILKMFSENEIELDPDSSKALAPQAVPVDVEEVPDAVTEPPQPAAQPNRAQRRAAARGEKGSSKASARTPEAVAKKRAANIKRRKAQKKARKKSRRREHIEIDQENTELISESVINQWQKLIGINPRII